MFTIYSGRFLWSFFLNLVKEPKLLKQEPYFIANTLGSTFLLSNVRLQ